MKKLIKRTILTITILFALLGATTSVLAAQGYITWKGSESFYNVKENLSKYQNKVNGKLDKAKQEIKDKEQVLRDKDKALAEKDKEKDRAVAEKQAEVDRKQKEVDEKQKEIERLLANQADKGQLDQAVKDMKELEELTDEMLESVE